MDDQQHPPTWTATRGVLSPGPVDPEVIWPGRRTLTGGERVLVGVVAAVLAGYLALLVAGADWALHPVLSGLAAVSAVSAVAALVASAWARRPARPLMRGRALRRVARPDRRRLARDLRAGRAGPPELRPAAVAWTCQTLQAPWAAAVPPAMVANGAASLARSGPTAGWDLMAFAVLAASIGVLLGLEIVRRRAAHHVADALDHHLPAPPALPDPA